MIACPDCGLLEELPALSPGDKAECNLCGADLERTSGRSITAGLCCALGTFALLIPGNLLPLLSVGIFGMHNHNRLASGIAMLWDRDWLLLAILTGAFALVLPFIRFGLLSAVLATVRLGYRPRWLGHGYRWALWLDVWAMPDVYLLAGFVGYFRLIHVSEMTTKVGTGGYCFLAAALLAMVARASIDRRTVWRAIAPEAEVPEEEEAVSCTTCDLVQPLDCAGRDCPRCGAHLRTRKPYAMLRATALTIAAFVLFFPANILPMNTSIQLGRPVTYTIFKGVQELFENGLWPLGVIIFCTSIAIPGVKILGMGWLIWSVRRRSKKHLILRTKFHRFITEIGRWSNVDPFAITVFVPLMTFGTLASSDAAWGSTAFIAVVVLTLLATMCFDSRLIWDAAERETT
ncbi:MAG: paraquat-inducible protein A [Chthoniobacterales bacterium]